MAVYCEQFKCIFFANPNTASKAIARTLKTKLNGRDMPPRRGAEAEQLKAAAIEVRPHHSTYTQLVEAGLMTSEQMTGLFKFTGVRNPYDQMVSKYIKHCQRLGNDLSQFPWRREDAGLDTAPDEDDDDDGAKGAASAGAKGHPKGAKKQKKLTKDAPPPPPLALQGSELQADFLRWLQRMDGRFAKVGKLENGPLDFLDHADYVIRFEAIEAGFAEVMQRIGAPGTELIEFNVTAGRESAPKKKKSYHEYYNDDSRAIVARMFAPVIERFDYRF